LINVEKNILDKWINGDAINDCNYLFVITISVAALERQATIEMLQNLSSTPGLVVRSCVFGKDA